MLYYGNFKALKNKIIFNIILAGFSTIVFLAVLIFTFQLLEVKSLSSIPLVSLFIFTLSTLIFIINCLRLPILNKAISGEIKIDRDYIKKYKMMIDYKENELNISKISDASQASGYIKLDQ